MYRKKNYKNKQKECRARDQKKKFKIILTFSNKRRNPKIDAKLNSMISVRHGPDKIGLLGKPPAAQHSFPFKSQQPYLPCYVPHTSTHPRWYDAKRVWSYTTFISCGSQSWETSSRKPILIIIMKHIIHNHYCNNQP